MKKLMLKIGAVAGFLALPLCYAGSTKHSAVSDYTSDYLVAEENTNHRGTERVKEKADRLATIVATAPSSTLVAKTYPASGVWYAGATLNGYSSFPGKTVKAWFEWGNSASLGQATAAISFTGEKSIGQAMRVPERGKYYYRLVTESSGLLVNGETLTFEAK